jgi:PatG C-terminal
MNASEVQEPSSAQQQEKCSACSARSSLQDAETGRSEKSEGKKACGLDSLPHVYALGRVEARFPSRSIEKEYVSLIDRSNPAGLEDQQTFYSLLSQPENRYLARKLSWVLTMERVPIYLLLPTGPEDLDSLLEAVRPPACPLDRTIIIGRRGPVATPEICGLEVPIVFVDQITPLRYSDFMKSVNPEPVTDEKTRAAMGEMFARMMQMADNTGSTDEHRALNYLAARHPAIYAKAAEELERGFSLSSVEAVSSRLSDSRKIISVVFSYTTKKTGAVEKYFSRVDVSEEFPFLVTRMAPYYDR